MALLFEAGFRVPEPSPPRGKIHGHHSDPKFLGGDPKQPLTDLPDVTIERFIETWTTI